MDDDGDSKWWKMFELKSADLNVQTFFLQSMWITINCGKFWERWEYQTTWPASWETVTTGHGRTDWFQTGKGVCQGCILPHCLFNLYAETSLSLFTFIHWRRKWQPTSSVAWKIPGMGEPGELPSIGLHRVGHNWSDLAGRVFCSLFFLI